MRGFRHSPTLLNALALSLAISLAAQDVGFEIESRMVLVPVTVSDPKGRTVDGLTPSDFQLLDKGRPREVVVDTIGTGVPPIALAVAVQSSGISFAALEKVRDIGTMIQPLITGQRGCAALVAFDENIDWLQECTSDPDALALAFNKLRPGDQKSARMLDAVSSGVDRLKQRPYARRVLLLISESRDRGSETDLESVVIALQTAGVTVYATTYSAFATAWTTRTSRPPDPPREPGEARRPPDQPPPAGNTPYPTPIEQRIDLIGALGEMLRLGQANTLKALTDATGGETFSFTRRRGLEDAIEKLGAELHSQYLLTFTPEEAPDPGYHRLEVRLQRSGNYRIRARPGYWSPN